MKIVLSAAILTLASARSQSVERIDSDVAAAPLQAIVQTDAHEWRAPVVDKTPPSESVDWTTPQEPVLAGRVARRESQSSSDVAVSTSSTTKVRIIIRDKKKTDTTTTKTTKSSSGGKKHSPKTKEDPSGNHGVKRAESKPKSKESSSPRAPSARQHEGRPQDVATADEGDLYAAALAGMLPQQYYNDAQVEEEARTVGAAVVTHMADSFRDETSKSLVFSGAVAGLAVSVLGTIAAVVALFRQRSEFAEVEFESDLPDLESDREVSSGRSAEMTAEATSPAGENVDASTLDVVD